MRGSRPTFALIAGVLLLGLTRGAGAADGDPYVKSCFATTGTAPCAQLQPPFAAVDAELSPDGRHLYVVVQPSGGGANGIRRFAVGAGGTLAPQDVTPLPAAGGDVDLSPDGRNVYVGAGSEFLVFGRDAASGALAPVQTISSLSTFSAGAVSPDGRSVYARSASQLNVYDRDPGSGTLTQKPLGAGCFVEELILPPCSGAVGIVGTSSELAVSSDGRHLYVTTPAPGGVAVFNRQADGSLSQIPGPQGGCVTVGGTSGGSGGGECAAGAATLAQARAVNLDPQGAYAIVSAAGGNTVFRRDAATGALALTDCLDELGGGAPPPGCHEAKGATGSDAAIAPNGADVALNASDVGLSAFRLDRVTGKLGQRATRGCFSVIPTAPCEYVPGLMGGLGAVTFSSNGLNLFAAFGGGSVAVFDIDQEPSCASRTVSVPRNARVVVPLACSDANGDAIRLEITAPPTNGSLGPVDQTNKRVLYEPETNFRGRDVFQFRALARGARGAPAVITINVLAIGKIVDRKAPNTRIRRGPPRSTRSRTAAFAFTSTESRSRFQCKLDKGRWTKCRSPKRYAGIKRGRHTFQVRAIDRAGNEDPTPAKRKWLRKR